MNDHFSQPEPTHIETDAQRQSPEWELAARCGFTSERWHHIEARARVLGADPFDLAVADGVISERDFVAALAGFLDVVFSTSPPEPDAGTPAHESLAFWSYLATGNPDGKIRIIAPNGQLAAILIRQYRDGRKPSIILTTRQKLIDRLIEADALRIAERAAYSLPEKYSARHTSTPAIGKQVTSLRAVMVALTVAGGIVGAILVALAFPLPALVLPPLLLAPIFIMASLSVLTATVESSSPAHAEPPVESALLPPYSILVPLYQEANVASALVAQLSALVYRRDRLEAFLLVEADDVETLVALQASKLESWMFILQVPPGFPRTKPRALNVALPFCRGDLVVVYDAEDEPEPDQLLRAAAMFKAAAPEVACLQARLAISNVHDGFLTRRFAIDYAALFDCVKAGMGRAGWPMPLGGSSNHFRTVILRQVGGWDAWNVTEDADLGLRLARFGWQVADLRSTTWEEAPNTLPEWMNQRTRWIKGWLQTLIVHARNLPQLLAGVGIFRAMIMASTGIAVLLGALLYPIFLVAITLRFIDPVPLGRGSALLSLGDAMLILTIIMAVLVECIPAIMALKRRKALLLVPYIALAPITHLLVSVAAWRALLELIRRPFHWHKTRHGQARREGGLSSINANSPRSKAPMPPK